MTGKTIGWFLVAGLVVLVSVGMWKIRVGRDEPTWTFERRPEGIMGTECLLRVVVDGGMRERAGEILDAAEARIRFVEAVASNWIDSSELSRLNAAPALERIPVSATLSAILKESQTVFALSGGAFDVTCRPLIVLWKEAGRIGSVPDASAIEVARAASRWELASWVEDGLIKGEQSLCFDLGGVAKGFAIDEAVDVMMRLGAKGALVDIGGDLKTAGRSSAPDGGWSVDVRDPDSDGVVGTLQVSAGMAICTSGDYARYVTIGGARYSHILDPRSGMPVNAIPSVTVLGSSAMRVDAWATALAVYGEAGLELLPDGMQALLVKRGVTKGASRWVMTPGVDFSPAAVPTQP